MESIKAIFKCRVCGQYVVADSQLGQKTPLTIEKLKSGGVLDDHCLLCECPGFMTPDVAEKIGEGLAAINIKTTPKSEFYGVADLVYMVKL